MFVTNAFFLAAWDPQTPLKAAILSGLTNLGLDLLLVNVFHWGIAGAAAATVAAQVGRTGLTYQVVKKNLAKALKNESLI